MRTVRGRGLSFSQMRLKLQRAQWRKGGEGNKDPLLPCGVMWSRLSGSVHPKEKVPWGNILCKGATLLWDQGRVVSLLLKLQVWRERSGNWRACPGARNNKLTIRKDLFFFFFKKGRGLHHELGAWGSCEEKAGAVGQWVLRQALQVVRGLGMSINSGPHLLSLQVGPFLHCLEGVQSKLLMRGWPGLGNKYMGPQSRGRAEGKSSASPGLPSSVLHGRTYHGRRG